MNCTEFNRIYVDLFKKLEEKDSIIKEFVISASQFLLKKQSNDAPKKSGKISNQYNPPIIQEVRVRRFEPKEVPTKTRNLVIGSSLVKNLVGDSTIPEDICAHDYRGSTCEKIEVVKQLPKTVIKTVLIQDGTNSILKEKQKNIDELFF